MKHATLAAAAALIILTNVFALVHAAINRSGQPDAEITLTERELNYSSSSDDSGVALNLRWVETSQAQDPPDRILLNQVKLEELGFDCQVAPSDPKADAFYARQRARTGFLALEYDGAAWQSWMEWRERTEPAPAPGQKRAVDYERISGSRLAIADAGPDAASLRAQHPQRDRVLVLPAIIRIALTPQWPATKERPAMPARLTGYIQDVPSEIHVPRPFSDFFRAPNRSSAGYRVRLRYGRLHEPLVTGVN